MTRADDPWRPVIRSSVTSVIRDSSVRGSSHEQAHHHLQDPGTAAEDPHHAPVPGHLPHRLLRPAADHRSARDEQDRCGASGGAGPGPRLRLDVLRRQPQPEHASSAWASCPTSRRRSSSSSWPASTRRWRSCRRKARAAARRSTNTPATPPCSSASSRRASGCSTSCKPERERRHGPGHRRATTTGWLHRSPSIITMTAGTVFLMWLGEQIDEYGIGNGISLIIMAGIVARIPDATQSRCSSRRGQLQGSRSSPWAAAARRRHQPREADRADRPVRRAWSWR